LIISALRFSIVATASSLFFTSVAVTGCKAKSAGNVSSDNAKQRKIGFTRVPPFDQ